MSAFRVRKAAPDDGNTIATIQLRCWHENLAPMVPTGFLDRFQHDVQAQKYAQRSQSPDYLVLIIEAGTIPIGFSAVKNNTDGPPGFEKDITALYICPGHQRHGAGKTLFQKTLSSLQQQGVHSASLWCISENFIARNFYECMGGMQIIGAVAPEQYREMHHIAYGWKLPFND